MLFILFQAKDDCAFITRVQSYEMCYVNAWLKICIFNLDLNKESVSEPQTLSEGYSRV